MELAPFKTQGKHGTVVVGTTPTRLWFKTHRLTTGMLIVANKANTVSVFVGTEGVTADTSPTGGIELSPDQSMTAPIDNPADVWLVATEENQLVSWMGC
jgi:hypothetical protein